MAQLQAEVKRRWTLGKVVERARSASGLTGAQLITFAYHLDKLC